MASQQPNTMAQGMARALGWFSLALGAMEILKPDAVKHSTGAPGPEMLYQAYGWREIASGVLILTSSKPASMVWVRVAGDFLDIATMAPATSPSNPHRPVAKGAMGFLVAITLVDLFVAMQGDTHDDKQVPASRKQPSLPQREEAMPPQAAATQPQQMPAQM